MNGLRFAALTLTLALLCAQSATAFPREGATCLQNQLAYLNYDPGPVDGMIGPQTRAAAQAWFDTRPQDTKERLPNLTRVTALQWCREIGIAAYQTRKFWPSRTDVRLLADAPLQDVKLRLLEDVIDRVKGFYLDTHNVAMAGSYDVVAAEQPDSMNRLLRGARRDRRMGFNLSNSDLFCADGGLSGVAYPSTMAICLEPSNEGENLLAYGARNQDAYVTGAHEFMHLIQMELSNLHPERFASKSGHAMFGPEWMVEGGAMYFMYDFLYDQTAAERPSLRRMFHNRANINLSLPDLRASGSVLSANDYDLSHLAAEVLVDRFGPESQFEYWRALGQLEDQDAAFKAVFGMSLSDFEAEFDDMRQVRITATDAQKTQRDQSRHGTKIREFHSKTD